MSMSEITEDRVNGAIRRITNGHAPMRIPVHPEDADVMIAEMWVELQRLRRVLAAAKKAAPSHYGDEADGHCCPNLYDDDPDSCTCGVSELRAAIEAAEVNNES